MLMLLPPSKALFANSTERRNVGVNGSFWGSPNGTALINGNQNYLFVWLKCGQKYEFYDLWAFPLFDLMIITPELGNSDLFPSDSA